MNEYESFIENAHRLFVEQAYFIFDLKAKDLYGMYQEAVETFFEAEFISYDEKQIITNAFIERENMLTTYVGNGVAIPHICYTRGQQSFEKIGWFRSVNGISAFTKSKQKIHLFLCILCSAGVQQICAIGFELLDMNDLIGDLLKAKTVGEMKRLINSVICELTL